MSGCGLLALLNDDWALPMVAAPYYYLILVEGIEMSELVIVSNGVPRDVINWWELSEAEREEFNYIDWAECEDGRASAEFFRYKGNLYDLNDMERMGDRMPVCFEGWDNYLTDSFFSGIVIRFPRDDLGELIYEQVIVGRYYS
jgi:hypothetical protein